MAFIEKSIQVNGNKVSYFEEGEGETPIIFIHGFPFNKSMWNNQLTELSKDYRVIAYDVRGHGESSAGSTEFTIAAFAEDLIRFMDELPVKKAILCGLSMGGYIAFHVIEKYTSRFTSLILSDTQCSADTDEAREKRFKAITSIKENGLENYAEESVKNLFAAASFTNRKEEISFIKNTIINTGVDNVCKTLMALAGRSEKCSILDQIKIPSLILVGREDKITPLPAAQKMHELITQSHLEIIEEAGHLSNLENPESFNALIQRFLKEQEK